MPKSTSPRPNYRQSLLIGVLAGISIAVIFAAGFIFRDLIGLQPLLASPSSQSDSGDYALLDEVQSLLDLHYLRQQPDYITREYAAIKGVISSLEDRYTFFIEPPIAQSESDVLAGTYGGIGVLLQRSETGDFLLYPYPDSAAVRAGIVDGDILRAINGQVLEITTQQDTVDQMLRGEVKEGSGVEVTIYNATRDEEFTRFILFDVVNVPSVLWRVLPEDERIGYLQIVNFTNRTPDETKAALTALREAGIDSLILDLRNNHGGLLQESIDVASQFLDGGVVLYEVSAQTEKTYPVNPGGIAHDWPLVVLVDQATASAAELVASAIKDYQRGLVIGQTTFGKGTVQQIFRLSDGSSVHITSAEFLSPLRHSLDGVGLEPDIPMIPDANGRDVEIGEAVRQLKKMLDT